MFQRDAARHDSCELGIVRHVAAGISGKGLFQHLFRNPADASGQAGKSGGIHDRLHGLVVEPGQFVRGVFFLFQNKQNKLKQLSSQQVLHK